MQSWTSTSNEKRVSVGAPTGSQQTQLDRVHKADLKIGILFALLISIPVLILYSIKSLPLRLLSVVLFTILFSLGVSLAYQPKRGEVFAITVA